MLKGKKLNRPLPSCHTNIAYDPVLGVASHHMPCPPGVTPSLEGSVQGAYPGKLLNQQKMTTTVKHHNVEIVLAGHDIGALMIHIPLANPWLAKIMPLSSCKIEFSASTVKMDGEPVGCADAMTGCTMTTCGEPISLPTAVPVANFVLNSVRVGMTKGDVIMGVASIASGVVLDLLFAFPMKPDSVAGAFLGEFLPEPKVMLKKGLAFLSGLFIGGSGKVSIGLPFAGIEAEIKREGRNLGQLVDGVEVDPDAPSDSGLTLSGSFLFWKLEQDDKADVTLQAFGGKPKKLN